MKRIVILLTVFDLIWQTKAENNCEFNERICYRDPYELNVFCYKTCINGFPSNEIFCCKSGRICRNNGTACRDKNDSKSSKEKNKYEQYLDYMKNFKPPRPPFYDIFFKKKFQSTTELMLGYTVKNFITTDRFSLGPINNKGTIAEYINRSSAKYKFENSLEEDTSSLSTIEPSVTTGVIPGTSASAPAKVLQKKNESSTFKVKAKSSFQQELGQNSKISTPVFLKHLFGKAQNSIISKELQEKSYGREYKSNNSIIEKRVSSKNSEITSSDVLKYFFAEEKNSATRKTTNRQGGEAVVAVKSESADPQHLAKLDPKAFTESQNSAPEIIQNKTTAQTTDKLATNTKQAHIAYPQKTSAANVINQDSILKDKAFFRPSKSVLLESPEKNISSTTASYNFSSTDSTVFLGSTTLQVERIHSQTNTAKNLSLEVKHSVPEISADSIELDYDLFNSDASRDYSGSFFGDTSSEFFEHIQTSTSISVVSTSSKPQMNDSAEKFTDSFFDYRSKQIETNFTSSIEESSALEDDFTLTSEQSTHIFDLFEFFDAAGNYNELLYNNSAEGDMISSVEESSAQIENTSLLSNNTFDKKRKKDQSAYVVKPVPNSNHTDSTILTHISEDNAIISSKTIRTEALVGTAENLTKIITVIPDQEGIASKKYSTPQRTSHSDSSASINSAQFDTLCFDSEIYPEENLNISSATRTKNSGNKLGISVPTTLQRNPCIIEASNLLSSEEETNAIFGKRDSIFNLITGVDSDKALEDFSKENIIPHLQNISDQNRKMENDASSAQEMEVTTKIIKDYPGFIVIKKYNFFPTVASTAEFGSMLRKSHSIILDPLEQVSTTPTNLKVISSKEKFKNGSFTDFEQVSVSSSSTLPTEESSSWGVSSTTSIRSFKRPPSTSPSSVTTTKIISTLQNVEKSSRTAEDATEIPGFNLNSELEEVFFENFSAAVDSSITPIESVKSSENFVNSTLLPTWIMKKRLLNLSNVSKIPLTVNGDSKSANTSAVKLDIRNVTSTGKKWQDKSNLPNVEIVVPSVVDRSNSDRISIARNKSGIDSKEGAILRHFIQQYSDVSLGHIYAQNQTRSGAGTSKTNASYALSLKPISVTSRQNLEDQHHHLVQDKKVSNFVDLHYDEPLNTISSLSEDLEMSSGNVEPSNLVPAYILSLQNLEDLHFQLPESSNTAEKLVTSLTSKELLDKTNISDSHAENLTKSVSTTRSRFSEQTAQLNPSSPLENSLNQLFTTQPPFFAETINMKSFFSTLSQDLLPITEGIPKFPHRGYRFANMYSTRKSSISLPIKRKV